MILAPHRSTLRVADYAEPLGGLCLEVQGLAQDFCERLNTKGLAHRIPNNGRVWHVANVI